MWTGCKRILKAGLVNFWRNGFVSLAAILVMTVMLFTIGSLLFVGTILNTTLEHIRDKVDINVYFVTSAPEEEVFGMQSSLEALPEVESVTYVSREEALVNFRERHRNDQLTLQALDELNENPLGASLSIKAKETSQYENIAAFLEGTSALAGENEPIVDNINYFQNKIAIDRLTSIIDSAERFGFFMIVVLAVASVLITFNTVRLAIYSSREEIAVMRLVGASNMYIRGPFVFEGILYGVIAALITLIIFYPLTLWLGPITENFFGNINLFTYYLTDFTRIFFTILLSGIALGAISSYLAVRKYLRV